jgi:hypothetical protein
MTGLIDLRSGTAGAAVVLSLAALGMAVRTSVSTSKKIDEQMDQTSGDLDQLTADVKKLRSEIGSLATEAYTLLARASALGEAAKTAHSNRQRKPVAPAANPRYAEFLRLVDEWSQLSGLKVQGAAAVNREEIAGLVYSKLSRANEERFGQCANNLVEYLVVATDTKFKQGVPKSVDAALVRMAELAGCDLISPQCGAAWDRQLHDLVDTMPRGANRAGTIARVAVRGLRSGSGKITKAKVFLYDD